jgi:hypothetical protein
MLLASGCPFVKPNERDYDTVEDVRLGHQALIETEMLHQSGQYQGAAHDNRCSCGLDPREASPLRLRQDGQRGQRPLYRLPGQPVVLHRLMVVALEPLVEAGQGGNRPGVSLVSLKMGSPRGC